MCICFGNIVSNQKTVLNIREIVYAMKLFFIVYFGKHLKNRRFVIWFILDFTAVFYVILKGFILLIYISCFSRFNKIVIV